MIERGYPLIQHAFEAALGWPETTQTEDKGDIETTVLPYQVDHPVFFSLLTELRAIGVPASTGEFIDLQRILEAGLVTNLTDLYVLARSVLIKDVSQYDKYDLVFTKLFGKYLGLTVAVEESTSDIQIEPFSSDEEMEMKEEPEEENQSEEIAEEPGSTEQRHGGDDAHKAIKDSRAVAKDGQQSKKKNMGKKSDGSRVDNKKKATRSEMSTGFSPDRLRNTITARKHREFDGDEIVNYGQFKRVLARLITLFSYTTDQPPKGFDVKETVKKMAQNGGLPEFVFKEEEERKPSVMLLFDVGGTTDPFRPIVEQLFKAAKETFSNIEIYYFHNAIYGEVWPQKDGNYGVHKIPLTILLKKDPKMKVIIIGDAYMARTDVRNGGLHDSADVLKKTQRGGFYARSGYENFLALSKRFPSIVWINPIKECQRKEMDAEGTMKQLERLFSTHELTLNGLEKAIVRLMSE